VSWSKRPSCEPLYLVICFLLPEGYRNAVVEREIPDVSHVFSPLQVRQYVVQVIFSVTFAFSCTMFELIIFEILGVLNSR